MEHTLQQARHALGYYRSQKYWQDDLRAYQDSKYDAVRAFSFEKSEGCHSFSKVEGEYPYPYEQRQREWKRFWPEGLEEAKPPAYAGAGTYRYPYLNLENGETETVSVRFDRDCTAPVPPRVSEKGRRKAISVTLDELLNTAKEMAEMHPGDPCYAILTTNVLKQIKEASVSTCTELTILEVINIVGMVGAGKSTLIRTINRMHDITNGTLTVDGTDVMQLHGKSLRAFRRRIGMIFQSFNLVTRTTVIKNVLTAFVPELPWWRAALGIFTKAEKTAALEALDKVGILDKAFVRADQLSGGQQQRVALARTLAQNPQIILADEPVASLDPVTAKQVMDDFQRINRDMRITILINIHHVDLALQYATRVIGIRAGRVVYDGPAGEVDGAVLDAIYQDRKEATA